MGSFAWNIIMDLQPLDENLRNGYMVATLNIDDLIFKAIMKETKSIVPCIVDEIKEIFDIPKIGTHTIVIGGRIRKGECDVDLHKSDVLNHKTIYVLYNCASYRRINILDMPSSKIDLLQRIFIFRDIFRISNADTLMIGDTLYSIDDNVGKLGDIYPKISKDEYCFIFGLMTIDEMFSKMIHSPTREILKKINITINVLNYKYNNVDEIKDKDYSWILRIVDINMT